MTTENEYFLSKCCYSVYTLTRSIAGKIQMLHKIYKKNKSTSSYSSSLFIQSEDL